MLKCISMFESFCCMHNWGSYCKRRVALQKCPIFLLERERERERERELDLRQYLLPKLGSYYGTKY